MTTALEGIRVLDFGRVIASAYCGTLLADMGAEVIKVERPGGEFDRKLGPFAPGGQAIVYDLITPRNKKSITLNTRHPRGRKLLDELANQATIIISGFTPKGNQVMGLDYERLKQINPGIILVAISGYGQNGPYADRPAFDAIAQAESGAMSYTGFPGGPPTRAAVPYADFSTAILGAFGAMLALRHQERTGGDAQQVRDAVSRRTRPFGISELERDCPGISRDTVRKVLRALRDEGKLVPEGVGPAAKWRPVGE